MGRTNEMKNMDNSWTKREWKSWGLESGYEMECSAMKERDTRRYIRYGTTQGEPMAEDSAETQHVA
jgi:hypothetical protein